MAQKTLNAFVVIGGRVDNTFGRIGTELVNLGSTVDEISEKLINFGKESLNIYKNYELSMTELETVWGSNGTFSKGSRELKNAMTDMNKAASEWAANSIFHTNDVANAMVEAAHAGWDYEQMLEGVPAAMAMAQAGNMDLSAAMNYVLKAQKSFGWEFDDLVKRTDEWIYAANRSAGTTVEFGETFLRLGSTVRLASNTEEMLALTKVMHDMGTTGSAAGTLIRTSLMKLYAPSGKASKVLDQLGVSAQEIKEMGIMEDQGLLNALKELETYGFSAFDPVTKQAKPALQVYSELGQALVAISGYEKQADESMQQFYGRVLGHETVAGIMSEVFGIRGIQGSMNILLSLDEAMQMYNDLTDNAADGTTEYVREMMNNTLYGSTELFLSKVEELHKKVGGELADDWQKIQGFVGGIVDSLNNMDGDTFSALVSGLEVIAIAGGTLVGAGSIARFIGMLANKPMAITMAAIGIASLARGFTTLSELKFEGLFGNMDLDETTLNQYIQTLGEDFNLAFQRVNSFAGALDTAVKNYQTASTTFSSDLLSAMLTKKEFTPEEKEAFEQLGIDIYEQVLASINASHDKASEFWNTLYGGDEVAAADPKFRKILDLLNQENAQAIAQAEGVSKRLKEAMLKGFEDGFTEDDYETILGLFEEYNDLVARASNEAQSEEMFIQQQKWLHKAQTASLEDVQKISDEAKGQRDQQIAELEDMFLTEQYRMQYRGLDEETLAANQKKYEQWRAKTEANYDQFLLTLYGSTLAPSDLRSDVPELLASLLYTGMFTGIEDARGYAQAVLGGELPQLLRFYSTEIDALGGEDAINKRIAMYHEAGNLEMENALSTLLLLREIVSPGNVSDAFINANQRAWENGTGLPLQSAKDLLNLGNAVFDRAGFEQFIWSLTEGESGRADTVQKYMNLGDLTKRTFDNVAEQLSGFYDLGQVIEDFGAKDILPEYQRYFAAWQLLQMSEQEAGSYAWGAKDAATITTARDHIYDLEASLEQKQAALDQARINLENERAARTGIRANTPEAQYWISYYENQITTLETEIQETETALAEWHEILDDHLAQSVSFPDAEANAQAARQAIEGQFSTPIEQSVLVTTDGASGGNGEGLDMMAGGGRRTSPAIFAEAGIPEWYIPEEHTDNTARLILGAAYGSGFDIFDLAEMMGARMYAEGGYSGPTLTWPTLSTGGSSGGGSGGESGGSGIQVQYSPVIHADNAAGVERALKEDKKRFEKWINEWWERKKLYESLVMYE